MRKNSEDYPIDFVVLWVDGSDPKWLSKKQKYQPERSTSNSVARYRDWGTFRYWFRSVEKYAPWVNHIYLVTDNQKPKWLNDNHPKLTIVDHKDIMDNSYLPTFNSQAIEMNLHKIPRLSEHFVYFNDDMFLINPTKPTDFFRNGLPVEIANLNSATGMKEDQLFAQTMFNDILLINRHFNKKEVVDKHLFKWLNPKYGSFNIRTLSQIFYPYFTGYKPHHTPTPFLKTTFKKVWAAEKETLQKTCSHKFRHPEDVNQYIFLQWQLCENSFRPRRKSLGKFIKMDEKLSKSISAAIQSKRILFLCINDDDVSSYTKGTKLKLEEAFESKCPNKSSFER